MQSHIGNSLPNIIILYLGQQSPLDTLPQNDIAKLHTFFNIQCAKMRQKFAFLHIFYLTAASRLWVKRNLDVGRLKNKLYLCTVHSFINIQISTTMGRIKNPLKIHWSGGVDGLVGYWRYGASYFRSFAQSIYNPRTDAQIAVRRKFAELARVMALLNPAYKVGFAAFKGDGQGPRDVAAGVNFDNITVTGETVSVAYPQLVISKGSTPLPYNLTAAVVAADHKVNIVWTDNTGVYGASAGDKIFVHLLNVTKGEKMFIAVGTRNDESGEIVYPAGWAGDTVHVYAMAQSKDGNEASDTGYLSQIVA